VVNQADELITHRLKAALALVDIRIIEHLLGGFRSVTTEENRPEIQQNCAQDPEEWLC
jgi:hypothetical protein